MKRLFVAGLLMAFGLGTVACGGSATIFRRAQAPMVDYNKEKFIVMPVDIHGLPGDKMKLGAALFGGFVGGFGGNGISLQPIKPALEAAGMGNLSWELAHGIYHVVSFHKLYDLKMDKDRAKLAAIPELVAKLVDLAATNLKLDFKPRFVVMAHIDGKGKGRLPGTLKYRVIGAVYDVQLQKVHAVTYFEKTTAEKAIMAEMATLGKQLFAELSKAEPAAKK
jgi:hypothetical protein